MILSLSVLSLPDECGWTAQTAQELKERGGAREKTLLNDV
jgi:hypothetical protein